MLDTGKLNRITTFPALLDYLRDELDWPIEDFTFDELTYDWEPKDFGLSAEGASGQIEIKQLRPIEREPWGIFFLSLPHKKLPVTVLRRLLGGLAIKKRASANAGERAAWNKHDILFIAAHGAGQERALAFAHFHEDQQHGDLPTLRVLGWDEADTIRRLSDTHKTLKEKLHWRDRGEDDARWRARWNEAFRERPGESIATSKALAKELAHLAREIRRRANELLVEENDQGPLRKLQKAFKEALIHDLKFDDFADMYAQTIAYGLLAAAISRESGALVAGDAAALAPPTNPFLKELLQTFLSAGGRKGGMDFDELGVNDVVKMLRAADMHAVLLDFDTKNPSEDPVIHFYELFLREYDSQKRMERGVFYTPRPVVSFIVRSVDEVLRTEFGLEDGLASTATWDEMIAAKPEIKLPEGAEGSAPFVRILDPATGTGTFLVEAVDLIHARMTAKWRNAGKRDAELAALWNDYVPNHLLPRLYGFELMMAPYAIAHMKLGLKLYETGYRFGSEERARIYLTNALEPAQDLSTPQFEYMDNALAHEAKAAKEAKGLRFTVVTGNPPYAGHSSNPSKDRRGNLTFAGKLVEPYFYVEGQSIGERNPKWLNNDYVKFIGLAQHILQASGVGVLGYITSNSWLDSPTFRGMRASLTSSLKQLWIVDFHGNVNKRERAPDGSPDVGVFEIREGTNVTIGVAGDREISRHKIDLFGPAEGTGGKFEWCLESTAISCVTDEISLGAPDYLFTADDDANEMRTWLPVTQLFTAFALGFQSHRDEIASDRDEAKLRARLSDLADGRLSDVSLIKRYNDLYSPDWLARTRPKLKGMKNAAWQIVAVNFEPFEARFLTLCKAIMDRPRKLFIEHVYDHSNLLLSLNRQTKAPHWEHAFVSNRATSALFLEVKDGASAFPLWLQAQVPDQARVANISSASIDAFARLTDLYWADKAERGDLSSNFGPRDVFDWIYAVLHSPTYRARYADYLKRDFARVPLPGSKALFKALVPLGTRLVGLHLLDADSAPDIEDPKGVRLAGHGEARIEKAPEWSAAGGKRVTISGHRWFEGVPERVWNFHIGGYQPAQKWLKDRAKRGGKKANSGRILTDEDQLHYRRMIVAMDKTIDLMAEIDRVIDAHGGWPGAFKGMND